MNNKLKTKMAVLLSGSGRTLQNFIDLANAGKLQTEITGVISSNTKAYGLERAKNAGIPTRVINTVETGGIDSFSQKITAQVADWDADLVAMAGFLSFYKIPPEWENKVMNIHPALLPAFGGKGYYGDKVHQAVIDYGCKISGCTVHFANNKYDHGPIILQKPVPVKSSDDVHSLAERVFEAELEIYPKAINLFSERRLEIDGRVVKIMS